MKRENLRGISLHGGFARETHGDKSVERIVDDAHAHGAVRAAADFTYREEVRNRLIGFNVQHLAVELREGSFFLQ